MGFLKLFLYKKKLSLLHKIYNGKSCPGNGESRKSHCKNHESICISGEKTKRFVYNVYAYPNRCDSRANATRGGSSVHLALLS